MQDGKISQKKNGRAQGIWHKVGSAAIFAANVWRKFHKRNKKSLNELLALQKESENPINGIIIRADIFNKIDDNQKQLLINILQAHPNLKMFIYDTRLKEHIVREADNKKAIDFLNSKIGETTLETTESESFTPFMGHNNIAREAATATSATGFLDSAKAAVAARRARTIRNEHTEQHDNHTTTYNRRFI